MVTVLRPPGVHHFDAAIVPLDGTVNPAARSKARSTWSRKPAPTDMMSP